MNKELEDFLSDVNPLEDFTKESNPLEEEVIETTETPSEEVTKEEDKLPFHKDPKVQKFLEKEISKRLKEMENKITEVKAPSVSDKDDEDDFYIRLIGNDTPEKLAIVKEFKSRDKHLLEEAQERAFRKLSEEKERETQAERQAEEKLISSIEEIEEDYNIDLSSKDPIARKNRVDFLNFVKKIAPKDEYGNIQAYPDMSSAYETFQEMRKTTSNNRAKELASKGVSQNGSSVTVPQERITFDNWEELLRKATQ